jgi:hypothetical protein
MARLYSRRPRQEPRYSRRSARRIVGAPLQQGHLDGLCGIYAAVNALSLLAERGRPFPLAAATALYRNAIDFVAAKVPLGGAVCYGFDAPLWLAVTEHLAQRVEVDHRISLSISRPFQHHPTAGFGRLRRAIEAALDHDAVVLASLTGAHNHYTVIRAYSAARFVLHDSSGLRWLSIAACGASYSRRRHQITAAWLIIVKVVDG